MVRFMMCIAPYQPFRQVICNLFSSLLTHLKTAYLGLQIVLFHVHLLTRRSGVVQVARLTLALATDALRITAAVEEMTFVF